MPFLNLNNNWSDLAQYYNQPFNNKPKPPAIKFVGFDDGLIRGGALNATLASAQDTLRIGKFLASGKGGLFVIKQVGLQLSNPKLETLAPPAASPTTGGGLIRNTINTLNNFTNKRSPNQIYNLGINTLAQVPINALGGHIIRHGVTPIGGVGFLEGSSLSVVNDTFRSPIKGYNYEQIALQNNKEQGNKIVTYSPDSNSNRLVKYLSRMTIIPTGVMELSDYNGGASSVYGLGTTRIATTSIRTSDAINRFKNSNNTGSFQPLNIQTIENATQANLLSPLNVQLEGSPLKHNKDIAGFNIEARIGVSTNRNIDAINAIDIVDSKTFYANSLLLNTDSKVSGSLLKDNKKNIDGKFGEDLIKFRIEFLNNDAPITDTGVNTDVLAFRAYLDDFNDGMNAKWNSYRYMGRGEEFYVYEGFTRDIGVTFTLFAHSAFELKPLYRKLNYLMSNFAPDYSSKGKMRGNIGYLTVGSYLYRQPGVFTDIKLSNMLDSNWEIGLDENYKFNGEYEVPIHIKVGLSFKPIHTFLPKRGKTVPFITPDKKAYPTKDSKGNESKVNKYLD
jgi:hypothetical protein